jgi:hypothetical protein
LRLASRSKGTIKCASDEQNIAYSKRIFQCDDAWINDKNLKARTPDENYPNLLQNSTEASKEHTKVIFFLKKKNFSLGFFNGFSTNTSWFPVPY